MPRNNSYSVYCKEHLAEFKDQLRADANEALVSWTGRIAVILLIISSFVTFFDAIERENPYAYLMLITYSVPIAVIVIYPLFTLLISSIEKYSNVIMDLVCFTGLLGFCFTLRLIFLGTDSLQDLEETSLLLQAQIAFVLVLATAFSYHATYWVTLARNTVFALIASFVIYAINPPFFISNRLPIVEGFLLGILLSWSFYESTRTRFYLKSTDADARQHLYNQLSKLVYPHQLERIKLGDELENTMPLKEGKAIVNVFDVQRSSEIRHERTQEFFMGVFQAFLQICMKGYEHTPLRSRAFRLKETGDGFISSVGYPFLPIDSRSLADSAVSTALSMFEAFNKEVEKFNYSRPIKGAMGLAYNSVQGTFQSGGIRSYDLFGDALIQASKYEELRKQPVIWNLFKEHALQRGLQNFNVLIIQEVVYNSLSPAYRDLFTELDLDSERFAGHNFQLMYDSDARYIYFHILA